MKRYILSVLAMNAAHLYAVPYTPQSSSHDQPITIGQALDTEDECITGYADVHVSESSQMGPIETIAIQQELDACAATQGDKGIGRSYTVECLRDVHDDFSYAHIIWYPVATGQLHPAFANQNQNGNEQ